MKRRIPGLSRAALPTTEVPDGLYLVSVERIQYRWDKQKPHYAVRLTVREPKQFVGTSLPARLYLTPKALWKLFCAISSAGDRPGARAEDQGATRGLMPLAGGVHAAQHRPQTGGRPRGPGRNDRAPAASPG